MNISAKKSGALQVVSIQNTKLMFLEKFWNDSDLISVVPGKHVSNKCT
jgi:hypothetical protein